MRQRQQCTVDCYHLLRCCVLQAKVSWHRIRLRLRMGRLSKANVFQGTRAKTAKGLNKNDLKLNKKGKIVGKRQSAAGRKKATTTIVSWSKAVAAARKALGITGFVAVKKGTPLYAKAKELHPQFKL